MFFLWDFILKAKLKVGYCCEVNGKDTNQKLKSVVCCSVEFSDPAMCGHLLRSRLKRWDHLDHTCALRGFLCVVSGIDGLTAQHPTSLRSATV